MKTIKVSEATNTQLDWLVAQCWFTDRRVELNCLGHLPFAVERSPGSGDLYTGWMPFNPSTDWSQMGPIIEREGINMFKYNKLDMNEPDKWCGHKVVPRPNMEGGTNMTAIAPDGPTPLIAAARCYVASKMGEEVEVPDELG